MGLKQASPGDRGGRRDVHFVHVKTARSEKWYAWTAGPIHWYVCHQLKRTKPCVREVTDGDVTCRWCAEGIAVHTMGYIPLYRQADAKSCFELLYDDGREQLDAIPLHARVLVGRGPDKADALYVLRCLTAEPAWQTADPFRLVPADLSKSLLRVWQIPELTHWFERTQGVTIPPPLPKDAPSDNPVSLTESEEVRQALDEGTGFGRIVENVIDRAKRINDGYLRGVNSAKNNFGRNPPKPSTNGDGKH